MSADDGLRILLVDDSADVRFVVRLGLEQDDRFVDIVEAANGREAIEVATAEHPDVILLDEQMPVMSGHEALPGLRQVVPDARIVVFSAVADEIDLTDAGDARPDALVSKSSDLCALYDILAAAG